MSRRRMDDDEDDSMEDEEAGEAEEGSAGLALGHAVEDSFVGDARFETVEMIVPGQVEGEDLRVRLIVNEDAQFFVALLGDEGFVRVGLCTQNVELSESIEQAILDSGESMTEFLEAAIGDDEGVENEMQHFHDDAYYFCSEIPYDGPDQLASRHVREETLRHLNGYIEALIGLVGGES